MQILDSESTFFVLFLVVFFMGWIMRGYYGRNSPDYHKSFSELKKQPLEYESRGSYALLSLFGLTLFAALILYSFYTQMFPWMQLQLIPVLRWLGVIIGLICQPIIAWVQWTLGASFSKTLTIQEGHKLVMEGPYNRVRHPMYSIHTFWFLSWFLISTNLFFGLSFILWVFYLVLRIPQEEKMLIEQFGDEYREYMDKTGSLFPRF